MKWWEPDLDFNECLMLIVFIAVLSCIIIAGAASENRNVKCKEAGGLPIDGVCYKKPAIIQIPAE